jgi:arachidonate 15-lipoxygenase
LHDFGDQLNEGKKNFFLEMILNNHDKFDQVEDYEGLFTTLPVPKMAKLWKDDDHFGKTTLLFPNSSALERLQGAACTVIQRISVLPSNFLVNEDHIKGYLEGDSLTKALTDGRLYLEDFSFLSGIELAPQKFVCNPYVLFVVTKAKKLIPLCIQLYSDAKTNPESNPLFFPSDPEPAWVFAKICVGSASHTYHQVFSIFQLILERDSHFINSSLVRKRDYLHASTVICFSPNL